MNKEMEKILNSYEYSRIEDLINQNDTDYFLSLADKFGYHEVEQVFLDAQQIVENFTEESFEGIDLCELVASLASYVESFNFLTDEKFFIIQHKRHKRDFMIFEEYDESPSFNSKIFKEKYNKNFVILREENKEREYIYKYYKTLEEFYENNRHSINKFAKSLNNIKEKFIVTKGTEIKYKTDSEKDIDSQYSRLQDTIDFYRGTYWECFYRETYWELPLLLEEENKEKEFLYKYHKILEELYGYNRHSIDKFAKSLNNIKEKFILTKGKEIICKSDNKKDIDSQYSRLQDTVDYFFRNIYWGCFYGETYWEPPLLLEEENKEKEFLYKYHKESEKVYAGKNSIDEFAKSLNNIERKFIIVLEGRTKTIMYARNSEEDIVLRYLNLANDDYFYIFDNFENLNEDLQDKILYKYLIKE